MARGNQWSANVQAKKIRPEGLIQYDNRRLHQGLSHLHQFD
ncbi:hypothetical protein NB724_000885 [Pantoea ananatis]|jgi:hypothetical protein|uniref:Uncharacterized protein n=1 Tax=Pantoea ananas TaxID=553 RepID=A0AAJ1CWG6_PANAN|nr:hypothetical protein [Pantoea ananatis]MCW0310631.1 hypothetical protein [Pantoea ananatis]MCW0315734.1 hypothetical protein [Pantoea ananatis]MCW0329564.1 hypothetical protein [Pantoea ananatis]MCW0333875.1 hypothetical protein [Pantoea ananatis]